MHRFSDSQRRLREYMVLDVAHIPRLLHITNWWVVSEAYAALAQICENAAIGTLEVDAEWLRGTSDGGGEGAGAEDSAFRGSRDSGLDFWGAVGEELKVRALANGAGPVSRLD